MMPPRNRIPHHNLRDYYLPWVTFFEALQWKQGEHVTIIGPTGQGKTELIRWLMRKRSHSLMLGTKPSGKDPTLDRFTSDGFKIVEKWPPSKPGIDKAVLWPHYEKPADKPAQINTFVHALEEVFVAGSWCVGFDELYAFKDKRMKALIDEYLSQGRSIDLSVIAATQRPANVTQLIYSQPTHIFSYQQSEFRDVKRMAEVSGRNSDLVRSILPQLPDFRFLYVNLRTAEVAISGTPKPKG
jgi:hypothetical protein